MKMSDHHRYYKDSYGSSSNSKRYHSPSDAGSGRLGGLSGGDYYDSSDSRSKRSRTDSYGAHTSSSRYADYPASSSSSAGGSRYKTAASSSSSSYYDHQGYKPSASASSSKYLEDYKGSGSSSRSSALKSNVRRVPPPLTPPCLSSKSASSLRLQPLMKVSLSSSSGVGSSSSGKDYYGSRMRQAPPEHHYSYSGSHSSSSGSYSKPEFKRPATYGSFKGVSSSGYHSTSRSHNNVGASYRSSTVASRKLLARSRAPPPNNSVNSRMRGRSTLMSSRRDDDIRRRNMGSSGSTSTKRDYKRSRSGSRGEERVKTPLKDKKEEEGSDKTQEKKQQQDESLDFASMVDGQVVVEEVAGDDEDDDVDESGNQVDGTSSTVSTEKNESTTGNDGQHKDGSQSVDDETKTDGKAEKDETKSAEKGSEEKSLGPRALLKLHCPYCDVRCISFREFTFHLKSSIHTRTMYNVVSDMKKKLVKIRQEMKDDQRKREKAEKVLSDTSSFCRVCELSFRTDPKEHEENEIHMKIKALIYRRCDVCDIDFRIWKVHIYHMAALEHAKRVAMKELQEREAKGDNVKGTNLSPEELGLNLMEIRTVFYCNACIRYIPIKGDIEEAKKNHCMTLNHLKGVEEFNERERRRAIREEARERARRRKQEETEKDEKSKTANGTTETAKTAAGTEGNETEGKTETENNVKDTDGEAGTVLVKQEVVDGGQQDQANADGTVMDTDTRDEIENAKGMEVNSSSTVGQGDNQNEADEDDDDEIELHAGEDDVEDESEDAGDWSRRTRSSQRGEGSSK